MDGNGELLAEEAPFRMDGSDTRELSENIIKGLIEEELPVHPQDGSSDAKPDECPRCRHWHVVKRGRDADGAQRYLCRGCSRTFNSSTRKALGTTKLDRATWMRYAECHAEHCTLREVSARCGVSLKTAFSMRWRVRKLTARSMQLLASNAAPPENP